MKSLTLALVTTFVIAPNVIAQPSEESYTRNVISSCHTNGKTSSSSGKCIVRTRIEGYYIMVRVEHLSDTGEKDVDILRLANGDHCSTWGPDRLYGCFGDFWYENDQEWGYVVAGNTEEKGKVTFRYNIGNAYSVQFDGALPRPEASDQEVITGLVSQIKEFYPHKTTVEIKQLLNRRYESLKNNLGEKHPNYGLISLRNYVEHIFQRISYPYRQEGDVLPLTEAIDNADYNIENGI